MFWKKLTAVLTVVAFSTNAVAMTMQELFDGVNAQTNVTSPGALQGQTMNIYSGGSLFMRAPKRTYQLAAVTPPSWSAGCGGIDLFAGGFSFINKEQFVAMLRNIGSNALGYGFKLAIMNLCPTCDNVMQALQTTAQAANRLNIDSCEAAKGIVNAAAPTTWDRGRLNSAKNFGVDTNVFADISEAWSKVGKDAPKADEATKQAAEKDPKIKDQVPTGNVVWKALKKVDGITDEHRQILMSMIGTVIFRTDKPTQPVAVASRSIDVKMLVGGNAVDSSGNSTDQIEIPIWKCKTLDADGCLEVEASTIKTDGFKAMVRTKMNGIIDNIASRKAYADASGTLRFLNVTDLPVYKMLAVATSLNNSAVADNMVSRFQELIAAKYAEAYIQLGVSDLRTAITKFKLLTDEAQTDELNKLMPDIERLSTDARNVLATAYAQTVSTYNIAQEVQHLERTVNSNLSATLRTSLAFGRGLR